ncbi:L-fucose/L-arabinose isomerase family protein [Anaerocolumna xylanovorans]|nr:fucose isomerase [Anaerocolumna xylanovorans]
MYKQSVVLGVVPVKRSFLSMEEALRQKEKFMKVIRSIKTEAVEIIDVDDMCENGIMWELKAVPSVIGKLKEKRIDALFIPFCDFGEEQVVAEIARAFDIPVLIWGARDEKPNTLESRGRDTQCGMFAATKVLSRYGVKYSYIFNCETEGREFKTGYENFIRVAAVVKAMKNLRVAKIGERPGPFMSVMTNDANLMNRFGITVVPISPFKISETAMRIMKEETEEFQAYYKELTARMDCSAMKEEEVKKAAAVKLAVKKHLEENNCSVGAFECWSAFPGLMGVCPCVALGELADEGLPLACETDVNGAITMAILRACDLYENAEFLADLTIRHPENDNGELLWHCGPFPYSLKAESSEAGLINAQEQFELKQGDLTICRFDELDGKYSLFAGEAKTTTGPKTSGTYVWMEVDNWKRWEEKLIFGPYIHHVGGVYGKYLPVLKEAARYLRIDFDDAHQEGGSPCAL